ncbi:MAG TPA: HAMP domain-containing methyl-accepting chemotaxis protein [Croceibacterium sp.]|nr:HAMP domain-containing methyl-accepting chemotaxis protein [Croceibacterium sp.]
MLSPLRKAGHSLAARITLAAVGMTVLLAVVGLTLGVAMFGLSMRSEHGRVLDEAALASSGLTASIAETRYYASRFAATGASADIDRVHATLDQAKQRLARTRERSTDVDTSARQAMEWLHYQVEGFESELAALENSINAYGPSESGNALAAAIDVSGEQLAGQARDVENRLGTASSASAGELARTSRRLAIIAAALLISCVAITLIGARFLTRTTAGSIREITTTMSRLAKGDRSAAIPGGERQDEIGEMARALTVFRRSADDLALLQQQAANSARAELARRDTERLREEAERARKAELLRDLSRRLEQTVGEVVGSVAAASGQLEATASDLAAAAVQSAQLTDEVTRSMKGTAAGVTAAATVSDQFAMSVAEISRFAANSASLAGEAGHSARGADATISELANTAQQIEKIVGMIDGIAQRTGLLALNASIEAARSGDAGKGFAVVASEVKELAGQTSHATGEVAGQIRAIQASTEQSVAALRRIGEQVHAMEGGAVSIAQAVDEQSLASHDLARNLAQAARGAEEIGEAMRQVRETTRSTGASASQLLDSASELHQQAASLRAQVDEFLGYVRAA